MTGLHPSEPIYESRTVNTCCAEPRSIKIEESDNFFVLEVWVPQEPSTTSTAQSEIRRLFNGAALEPLVLPT